MASPSLAPSGWTASLPPAMPWTPEHQSSNIILRVENEFRIIQRPPTYADALNAVYTHFPCMKSRSSVKLSTSFDSIWPQGTSAFSPVTSDTWRFIRPNVSVLSAEAEPEPKAITPSLAMFPRGRKPVIYLFPPSPLRASVSLSLAASWVFDAIYPTTNIRDDLEVNGYPQTIQWEVDAKPSGNLVEIATDVQISYLFWEARASLSTALEECPVTSFVPGLSTCTPFDSVVLEHADLLKYLDTALKVLGLHTEARTSFITYWLPAFQKHPFIALRFVPQSAFETAAPLAIEPKPDVVTRVFMLFKGLSDLRDGEWFQAVERAEDDITRWKDIVGIEEDKQADQSLFRVLEWGGMEVYD